MRRIKGLFICLIFICTLRISLAENDLWTEGTMNVRGHSIDIHAIINDALPAQLQQIKLTGRAVKPDVLFQSLWKDFSLHPDFSPKHSQIVDDYYISMWAEGYSATVGYDARLITNCEVEQLFPIDDPELNNLYGQCVTFLAGQGITTTENAGYICRQIQKNAHYTIVLLPYQIEGLSTEYKNQIINRDSLHHSGKTNQHIMDSPWADFVFDEQNRLVKAEMSLLTIVSAKPLSGNAISWYQAAENVLDAVIATQINIKRTLESQPNYDEEKFWLDYRVQLSRVIPMWMPNWSNICLPGWCVQYQLYDATTGVFQYAMAFCANALTGEVACYHI